MPQLIGTAPNQVPTNADLGSAAFMDSSAFYGTGLNPVFRNRIINGDMRIDQRNAGASVSGSSTFTVDRWRFDATNAGNFTAQQVTDAPAGFTNSLRITTNTAFSPTVAQFFNHHIEGFNVADFMLGTANASTFTLSFWVKGSLVGTYSVAITNVNNDYAYPTTFNINNANTWEYKTITVPGPTAGTWLTNNGVGLRIKFNLNSGSFYAGTANTWVNADRAIISGTVGIGSTVNATLQLTGVQLEKGTQATPFEYRSYGTELALCQRYYYRINMSTQFAGVASGYAANASTGQFLFKLGQTMRVAPSAVETTGTASDYRINAGSGGGTLNVAPTFVLATTETVVVNWTTPGLLTVGHGVMAQGNTTNAFIAFPAEL